MIYIITEVKAMYEKIREVFDDIPDFWKAVIFVSAISIFWSIIL